jgi:protein-S-isoprenylcysteine O-methyltransferase Ste14
MAAAPKSAGTRDTPGVIAPPPLIYALGLGLGFALEAVLPGGTLPAALRWPVGAVLLLGGIALQSSFIAWFRRAGTPVAPYNPTKALVTDGPYRISRNPAYLGFALIYIGIAVLADAPWVLVPLPVVLVVMQLGVIAREERYLERLFGEEYRDFKARTRRWI